VPDVILATGPEIGLRSALAVTRTLPIVMIAIDYDPLARGYVTSLARPSGNVTGVCCIRVSELGPHGVIGVEAQAEELQHQ
jgi:putative ABC transport system substrate-binding protein